MKKIAITSIILFTVLSCSKDENETVYEKYKGNWDIEQKFVDGVEVSIDDCDSAYNRIIINHQKESYWVFCNGIDAVNHRIEFDEDSNGKLTGMYIETNTFQSQNKTFIEGKITNGIFEITYTNDIEPNIIRLDQFKKN